MKGITESEVSLVSLKNEQPANSSIVNVEGGISVRNTKKPSIPLLSCKRFRAVRGVGNVSDIMIVP